LSAAQGSSTGTCINVSSPPVASTSSSSTSCIDKTNSQFVSPIFKQHLHYPTKITAKKSRSDTALPKAISGQVFRKYLQDKRDKKVADEAAKEQRRVERQLKKTAKENATCIPKKKAKTTSTLPLNPIENTAASIPTQSTSTTVTGRARKVPKHLLDFNQCDESLPSSTDEEDEIDENRCAKCNVPYDHRPTRWIGCDFCGRWVHRKCSGLCLANLSEKEIRKIEYQCEICDED